MLMLVLLVVGDRVAGVHVVPSVESALADANVGSVSGDRVAGVHVVPSVESALADANVGSVSGG